MANKSLDDYIEAAKYGNVEAMLRIGNICSKGIGVSVNYEIAAHYYKMAADSGNADGMLCLGILYENGNGVPQSYEKAAKWYQKID